MDDNKDAQLPRVEEPDIYDVPAVPQQTPAGLWRRLLAFLVDWAVLKALVTVLRFLLDIPSDSATSISFTADWLIFFVYFIVMTKIFGQTLGKMLLRIQVVHSNSSRPLQLSWVLYRETIGKFVCWITLGIGFFLAAFTPNRQGIHDMMARTNVVIRDEDALQYAQPSPQ